MEITRTVDRIGDHAGALLEGPALFRHDPVHDGDVDVRLEPLQLPQDQCAMGPGARVADIQVIAAGLRLEAAAAGSTHRPVRCHPVAELARLAHEAALVRFGVVPHVLPLAVY